MQFLEQFTLTNKLNGVSGKLKTLFAVLTLLVCSFSTAYIVPLLVFCIMLAVTIVVAGIPPRFYAKLILAPAGFGLVTFVLMLFFFGKEPFFSIHAGNLILTATKDGFDMALISVGRMLGSVSCLLFLALTTPMADIFALLKKLKLPDVFIDLSMLIYRFIFIMVQEALRMEYAQKMRLGYSDVKGSFRALSLLAGNLFVRSWDSADKMLTAMNSRGYEGIIHVLDDDSPIPRMHLLSLAGFELVLVSLNFILPR